MRTAGTPAGKQDHDDAESDQYQSTATARHIANDHKSVLTHVNDTRLFAFLRHQPTATLLAFLQQAYRQLTVAQRETVFSAISTRVPASTVNGEELVHRITRFHSDSLAGTSYAEFEWNSKNYDHVPEETQAWFDLLNDLLTDSARLTAQGEHTVAVECFGLLYQLIDRMEEGDEIVFAHELGSGMLPGDEQPYLAAFVTSLAAVTTPDVFTATVLPLIRRVGPTFTGQVYAVAMRVVNTEQRAALKAEVKRQKIRTTMKH